ncbi:MAG: MFS transporter [Chloroflexi bacterium]|nr:MFS transporter [Chloroflexota bacterium]
MTEQQQYANYKHNAFCISGESTTFNIAIAFISASTVIPTLVTRLTSSPVMVGLVAGLPNGAWLLPQLFVAAWTHRFPLKKPILAWSCLLSRPMFLLIGLAIGFFGATNPGLALASLLVGQILFYFGDAVASIPWFDLLARTIPPRRRGRVMGIAQITGGIGGILVGIAVRYILSDQSPIVYPWDYGVLFLAAGTIMMLGVAMLWMIKEDPPQELEGASPGMAKVLASIPTLIRTDKPFAHLLLTRVMTGFISLATAFYVIHATNELGMPTSTTGLFISAQVVGALVSGLLLSWLQDKRGVLFYMRLVTGVGALPPLLALLIGIFARQLGSLATILYLLIFVILGIYINSIGWPTFGWILEHAQERQRPIYIGVSNTLGALTMLAPPLGGWIASALGYQAVFIASIGFAALTLFLTLKLPEPGTHLQSSPGLPPAPSSE